MAKVLKCDGCKAEMDPSANIAATDHVERIRRRLGTSDISVCLSVTVDGRDGEVCLACVKKLVKEYKQDVVREATPDRAFRPLVVEGY